MSNVANVTQKEDDSIRVNAENQDPMRHETSDLDVLNQVQDSNGQTHDTAYVLPTQLTSTPAPANSRNSTINQTATRQTLTGD